MDVYEDVDQVDDYNEDEWYDDYDDEPEYGFYEAYLCKAENGQLYVNEVYALTNGRTDSYFWTWYDECEPLTDYNGEFRSRAIEWSRTHKPGESIETYKLIDDEDEDDEDDEDEDNSTDDDQSLTPPSPTAEDDHEHC